MWVPYGSAGGWPILPLVLLMYGGLAVVATALHGRLALDRPAASHLTEFYLVISIGGALASAFVALAAPVIFPGVWEFPILLVLALVALGASSRPRRLRGLRHRRQQRPRARPAPSTSRRSSPAPAAGSGRTSSSPRCSRCSSCATPRSRPRRACAGSSSAA